MAATQSPGGPGRRSPENSLRRILQHVQGASTDALECVDLSALLVLVFAHRCISFPTRLIAMRQSLGHFGMNDCVPAHAQVRVDVLLPDVVAGRAADLRDDVQP